VPQRPLVDNFRPAVVSADDFAVLGLIVNDVSVKSLPVFLDLGLDLGFEFPHGFTCAKAGKAIIMDATMQKGSFHFIPLLLPVSPKTSSSICYPAGRRAGCTPRAAGPTDIP
jgi:hypothetical protein